MQQLKIISKRAMFIGLALSLLLMSGGIGSSFAKELTVWWAQPIFPTEEELIKQYIKEFETKTGSRINLEIWPHQELNDKLGPAVATGMTPDVLWHVHQMFVAPLAERGFLADVSDVITDLGPQRMVEGVVDIATIGDLTYAVPYYIYGTWLHYRKDLFTEAGYATPPETWDEFVDACSKINDPKKELWAFGLPVGEAAQYDAHSAFTTMLVAYGGKEVSEDGKSPTIDSPATIEVLKLIDEMWDKEFIPHSSAAWTAWDNNSFYQAEKVAVTANPTGSILAWLRKNKPELYAKSRTMMWPKGTAGKHYLQLGQYGFYVFKKNKDLELSKQFIKFFYEKERYFKLAKEVPPYFFPIFNDLLKDPFYKEEIQLSELVEQLLSPEVKKTKPGWPFGYNAAVGDTWSMNIYPHMVLRVVLGGWTPEEAVKEASNRMQSLCNRYYKK